MNEALPQVNHGRDVADWKAAYRWSRDDAERRPNVNPVPPWLRQAFDGQQRAVFEAVPEPPES